ncbi:MAG: ABC transporter permease [Bacteroidales bacterium]|nr:ABC transporter permease [Bacteroidales bacterium]
MQIDEIIRIAIHALLDHKFRSFLTMLGIIFGVSSVIAMLSIGEGAKREAIAKYQDLGVNNIIVRERNMSNEELEEVRAKFSPGLSLTDAASIKKLLPTVDDVAPQAEREVETQRGDVSTKSTLIGVTPAFIEILNYEIANGRFITQEQYDANMKVCVLGAGLAKLYFANQDPIGRQIKVEDQWMEIIGVMASKAVFTETVGELASRDLNNDVYIPLSTFNKRFSKDNLLDSEIKQITVKVKDSNHLLESAEVIRQVVDRHHFNNQDYSIVIPYELLKQEENERRIYNFLLGAIAAISLLVGGIGIMNIMLATVMERTREIGIRRAIGARRSDIMSQFVIEAVAISITGGMIGVLLGLSLSWGIALFTNVTTFVRLYSVLVAFTFSVVVGVCFGWLPARKAANLSPIESIRYE